MGSILGKISINTLHNSHMVNIVNLSYFALGLNKEFSLKIPSKLPNTTRHLKKAGGYTSDNLDEDNGLKYLSNRTPLKFRQTFYLPK